MLIAATLFAQGPRHGFGRDPNAAPPTPAEIVAREVQMLTRFLTLDTGQQSAATTALTNAQAQLALNAATLKTDRAQLVAEIKANNQSGTIDTLTSTIANLQGQQDAIRAKAAAAIYATLRPDQITKLGNGLGPLLAGGPGRGPRF